MCTEIANKFPKIILYKRMSHIRPPKQKWKPDVLYRKTERSYTSKTYEFFQQNVRQPSLSNHNTPGLRKNRVDPQMDINLSSVNVHVKETDFHLRNYSNSPNRTRKINRPFLEPIGSNLATRRRNKVLAGGEIMDIPLGNYNNYPNPTPEINRQFRESKWFNLTKEKREKVLTRSEGMDFPLGNYSNNRNPTREINRHLLESSSISLTQQRRNTLLTGGEMTDFPSGNYSNNRNPMREINRPFLEPIEGHQTNFYSPNITIRNEIHYPRPKYNKPEVRRNCGALGRLPIQEQSLTQSPMVSNTFRYARVHATRLSTVATMLWKDVKRKAKLLNTLKRSLTESISKPGIALLD